jgi:cysteine desulfurase
VRDPDVLEPLLHGGGQQHGVRPGTENVVGAVGLGRAAELAGEERDHTVAHTGRLRGDLERRVMEAIADTQVNGAGGDRAPHIANLSIPGTDSGAVLMQLDTAGIACSSGSACATGSTTPSHVLAAMGVPTLLATASLRFSFSHQSTAGDVDRVLEVLPQAVQRVRTLVSSLDAPESRS